MLIIRVQKDGGGGVKQDGWRNGSTDRCMTTKGGDKRRDGGTDGGRDGGRDGGMYGGTDGGRDGGMYGGRDGWRNKGKRECTREVEKL